ncbi:hypothetical protein BHE74_00019026 [Ensete ventricosum]|nr:hypothetical protein BHE74_00019026 [Ensete ventricosum]RZR84254.1 hypothetical protein BHM03_00011025 [Ensete ventricosum]
MKDIIERVAERWNAGAGHPGPHQPRKNRRASEIDAPRTIRKESSSKNESSKNREKPPSRSNSIDDMQCIHVHPHQGHHRTGSGKMNRRCGTSRTASSAQELPSIGNRCATRNPKGKR